MTSKSYRGNTEFTVEWFLHLSYSLNLTSLNPDCDVLKTFKKAKKSSPHLLEHFLANEFA